MPLASRKWLLPAIGTVLVAAAIVAAILASSGGGGGSRTLGPRPRHRAGRPQAGDRVRVEVVHQNGKTQTVDVTLGRLPAG